MTIFQMRCLRKLIWNTFRSGDWCQEGSQVQLIDGSKYWFGGSITPTQTFNIFINRQGWQQIKRVVRGSRVQGDRYVDDLVKGTPSCFSFTDCYCQNQTQGFTPSFASESLGILCKTQLPSPYHEFHWGDIGVF